MAHSTSGRNSTSPIFDAVEITSDRLTGRGGLALFSRYLRGIDLSPHLGRLFGSMRKSEKGLGVPTLFKQIFCFFVDGTSRHLVRFDELREDAGYAGAIESSTERMASSHQIKRFFYAFSWQRIWNFRRLLQRLFLWRLRLEEPDAVVLGMDTMPMDNDQAKVRHGVQPTYKRFRGFQPFQITWGRFVIDAVFRGGAKHSNHGDTAEKAVRHLVSLIRKDYSAEVPIVIRLDSGFFDQKLFEVFEELGIGYIATGKLYSDIKRYAGSLERSGWNRFQNTEQAWEYVELGDCRGNWSPYRFRRCFYTRPVYEDEQRLLEFARPDTILYTNLGKGERIDRLLADVGLEAWTEPKRIIELHHGRGADELVHRGLKDFASETLPFKRFAPNTAYYYSMLVAHFVYECFKEDVVAPVVPISSYATRLRREVVDIAAKIVRTSGKTILKVTESTWTRLGIAELWKRTADPPRFRWA